MARIKIKLRELRDAKVNYISLVDRAATRIPFRVVKRDEEAMIDLTKIFKKEQTPEVVAVVTYDHADPETAAAVTNAIKEAGFAVDRVVKGEDTVKFLQQDGAEDVQLIRLSDETVVAVKGMQPMPEDATFSEMVASQGFYSGIDVAMNVARQQLNYVLYKTSSQSEAVEATKKLMADLSSYVTGLAQAIPTSCFKADFLVNEALQQDAIQKAEKKKPEEKPKEDEKTEDKPEDGKKPEEMPMDEKPEDKKKPEEPPCKKEEVVVEPPVEPAPQAEPPVEPPVEVPPVEVPVEEVKKEEPAPDPLAAVLATLQSIATKQEALVASVQNLTAQVAEVGSKNESLQNVVDGLAKKSEDLEGKFGSVVVAAPPAAERPAPGETVTKRDEDPRTGCFDTAFLRKRR